MRRTLHRTVRVFGAALACGAVAAAEGAAEDKAVIVVNGPGAAVPVSVQATSSAPVFVRPVAEPYQRRVAITSGLTGEYCRDLDVPVGKRLVLRHVSGTVDYRGPARPRVWARAGFDYPTSTATSRSALQVTDLDEGTDGSSGIHKWGAHLDLLGFQGADAGNGGTLAEWRVCVELRHDDASLSFIGIASGYLEDAN